MGISGVEGINQFGARYPGDVGRSSVYLPGTGWVQSNAIGGSKGGMLVNPELDFQKAQSAQQFGLQSWQAANKERHFQDIFGALNGAFGSPGPFQIGGNSGTGPAINAGPTYNPQQVDQQVNAARAKNDASAQTQSRAQMQKLASRGYGADSPLLAAFNGQLAANTMATNADTERDIRQTAAGQNAQQTLQGQQAREGQYAARQTENIQRQVPFFQRQSALITALAGLA